MVAAASEDGGGFGAGFLFAPRLAVADYWRGAAAAPPPGAAVAVDDMAGGFLSELEAAPANRSAAKPLASLEALVVVGSSVDDVVAPWQSTFFGAAEGSDEVVPLRERRLY